MSDVQKTMVEARESNLTKAFRDLASGYGTIAELQEKTALEMCLAHTVLNVGIDKAKMTLVDYASSTGVAVHWFLPSSTSVLGKQVKASRDEYVSFMEAVVKEDGSRRFETNNIDKIWSRIKELSGKGSNSKESETDKSCDTVTFKELATILRRIQKSELSKEYMPKSEKAHTTIELAYELMGGSLADVYKPEK